MANNIHSVFRSVVKERENEEVLRNKQVSKDRLEKILIKKFNTTFIGALDSFEQAFGYLWGHGSPYHSLTENQKQFRNLWNDTRNEVLNKGNAQLRGTMNEVGEYDVIWNKKQYEFRIGD